MGWLVPPQEAKLNMATASYFMQNVTATALHPDSFTRFLHVLVAPLLSGLTLEIRPNDLVVGSHPEELCQRRPDRGMASNRESSEWPNGINPGLPKGHSELNRSGLLPGELRDVGEMGGEGWWLSRNKNLNRPGLACIKPAESDPTMVLCKGLLEAWVQPDNHHRGRHRLKTGVRVGVQNRGRE
ncbi:hypothetical protein C8R44DRAFT_727127 [Mycena epipterygia]|nr:hypothetical protein C8R44DRAFT_727127 [Mycena epipterygia]